jgi:hypothetical protein
MQDCVGVGMFSSVKARKISMGLQQRPDLLGEKVNWPAKAAARKIKVFFMES